MAVSRDNCPSWSYPATVYEGTGVYPTTWFSHKNMFVVYLSNPDSALKTGASYCLTVSVCDTQAVAKMSPWTRQMIELYIAADRGPHWLAMTVR